MFLVVMGGIRRKAAALFLAILLWGLMFVAARTAVRNCFAFNVTVENSFVFSYPFMFNIESVYGNHRHTGSLNDITTNSPLFRPVFKNLSEYNQHDKNILFNYPSTFILQEHELPGGEIIYHIEFRDSKGSARGFVQVWKMPLSIDEFLEKSLQISKIDFINFSSKKHDAENRQWTIWEYIFRNKNQEMYHALEAFHKHKERMYRISYFLPEKDWSDSHSRIFYRMVDSFELKKSQ